MTPAELDAILTLQLAAAWAGERGSDDPRLGWWHTDMVSEYGGHALFARLAPRTAQWAALEVAREAARRVDELARSRDANPDRLWSLFHFGYAIDEQLGDRLAHHKRSGKSPREALPELPELESWLQPAFVEWVARGAAPRVSKEPSGRRLTAKHEDPVELARALAHALLPLSSDYPCPHVRHA